MQKALTLLAILSISTVGCSQERSAPKVGREAAAQLAVDGVARQGAGQQPVAADEMDAGAQQALSMLNDEALPFKDALNKAVAAYGPQDDRVRSMYFEAMDACEGAMQTREEKPDPAKDWASKVLEERCTGFVASKDIEAAAPPTLYDVSVHEGEAAATAKAKQTLASSASAVATVEAAENLLSANSLSLKDVFGDASVPKESAIMAFRNGALLLECEASGGCGSHSLVNLAFCSTVGCREGVGFQQSLQDSLPPRDYQAALAARTWLVRTRAHKP
jgi:hypothetical protein